MTWCVFANFHSVPPCTSKFQVHSSSWQRTSRKFGCQSHRKQIQKEIRCTDTGPGVGALRIHWSTPVIYGIVWCGEKRQNNVRFGLLNQSRDLDHYSAAGQTTLVSAYFGSLFITRIEFLRFDNFLQNVRVIHLIIPGAKKRKITFPWHIHERLVPRQPLWTITLSVWCHVNRFEPC